MKRQLLLVGWLFLFASTAFADDAPDSEGSGSAAPSDAAPAPTPAEPAPVAPPDGPPVLQQNSSPERFLPWVSVQYATSPEITEQKTGYSSFEALVPFAQWTNGSNSGLFFVNGDSFVNNFGRWGSNIGVGGRWFNGDSNRILGFNAYWDNNDTSFGTYNQLGLGIESLGRYVDFRANGYIPLGDTQKALGVTFTNPTFFNHFILLDQNTFSASALSGFDTEVGGWVPYLGKYGLRAYAGLYGYEGRDAPWTTGGHFRLEELATDNLSLNLTLDSDRTFGTTVAVSAAFRFGGGSRRRGSSRGNVFSRMVDPVARNVNITVQDPETTVQVPATKPGTNTPIYVDHFASYSAAGGNGTFEHPFNTLQNPNVPQQADILFVWANSNFNGQSMTLRDNQRFLGEGRTFLFTASQGTFVLPRATSFTNAPIINGSIGDAITLANNDEISNFVISNPGGNGIFGSGVSNFSISNNTITGAALNGISLTAVGGTGNIQNNVIANNGVGTDSTATGTVAVANGNSGTGNGILISSCTFSGSIAGNTITGNGNGGTATATTGTFAATVAVANGGDGDGNGILINGGSILGVSITNNTITNNGIGGAAQATGTATNGTTAVANAGAGNGSGLAIAGGSILTGPISGNSFSGNGIGGAAQASANAPNGATAVANAGAGNGSGLAITGSSILNGSIFGNSSSGNGNGGNATATATAGVGATAVANAGNGTGSGFLFDTSTINGSITGNTLANNGDGGNATGSATAVGAVTVTNGGAGTGFGLFANATTVNGSFSSNTLTGNGNGGNASGGIAAGGTGNGVASGFFTPGSVFTGGTAGNTSSNNGNNGTP